MPKGVYERVASRRYRTGNCPTHGRTTKTIKGGKCVVCYTTAGKAKGHLLTTQDVDTDTGLMRLRTAMARLEQAIKDVQQAAAQLGRG